MIYISWNVCGLGSDQTKTALNNLCISHKPDWFAIFELKILKAHLPLSFLRNSRHSFFAQNERVNSRPNIWIFCHEQYVADSVILRSFEQFIAIKTAGITLIFVHTKNNYIRRRELWQDLSQELQASHTCIMGDFNVVLGAHERSSGMVTHGPPIEEFQNFITQNDLTDVEAVGNKYTWATRRNNIFMAARLDRALVNHNFLNNWDEVELVILPMLCSDHNRIRLRAANHVNNGPYPFRFQDMWTLHPKFTDFVRTCWVIPIHAANTALRLQAKLKCLKRHLKAWNSDVYRNVFNEIQLAAETLDATQQRISLEGDSDELFNMEMNQTAALNGVLV